MLYDLFKTSAKSGDFLERDHALLTRYGTSETLALAAQAIF